MPKSKPVAVKIGKRNLTLEVTWAAQQEIDLHMGGLQNAQIALTSVNLSQITRLICAGCGISDSEEMNEIGRDLFHLSIPEKQAVIGDVTRFVTLMFNGGIDASASGSSKPSTGDEGNA